MKWPDEIEERLLALLHIEDGQRDPEGDPDCNGHWNAVAWEIAHRDLPRLVEALRLAVSSLKDVADCGAIDDARGWAQHRLDDIERVGIVGDNTP